MNKTHHYLGGRTEDGQMARILGVIYDNEFEAKYATKALPPGWVIWHVEESEYDPQSARVRDMERLRAVEIPHTQAFRAIECGTPSAVFFARYGVGKRTEPHKTDRDAWAIEQEMI